MSKQSSNGSLLKNMHPFNVRQEVPFLESQKKLTVEIDWDERLRLIESSVHNGNFPMREIVNDLLLEWMNQLTKHLCSELRS